MSKFFSRFSKRKLVTTVSVFLVVAIAAPLLSRQFWVYDADMKKMEVTSLSKAPADDVGEVTKDQLVKSKKYAQLMIKYLKAQPDTSSQAVLSKRVVDLIGYDAIDQAITNTGELVNSPTITYQAGVKYLSEVKNQMLAMTDGANAETKSTLEGISSEIDKSIKLLGIKSPKDENQGDAVKTEFLRLSDLIGSKADSTYNAKDILKDSSAKLRAFPADNSAYLTAIQSYAEIRQAQNQLAGNDQQIATLIAALIPLLSDGQQVALNYQNQSSDQADFIQKAKAATQKLPANPYSAKALKFTEKELSDFHSQAQAILKDKSKDLTAKNSAIGALAYDKLHPNPSVTESKGAAADKENFIKNYGSSSTALATLPLDQARNTIKYNIEYAQLWNGWSQTPNPDPNMVLGPDGAYHDKPNATFGIWYDVLCATYGSQGWEAITKEAAKQGYDISGIKKSGVVKSGTTATTNEQIMLDIATADAMAVAKAGLAALSTNNQIDNTTAAPTTTVFKSSSDPDNDALILGRATITVARQSGSILDSDTDAKAVELGKNVIAEVKKSGSATLDANDTDAKAVELGKKVIATIKASGSTILDSDTDAKAVELGKKVIAAININDTEAVALAAIKEGAIPGGGVADTDSLVSADISIQETNEVHKMSLLEQAVDVRDEFNEILTGTTEINGKRVPNDEVLAATNTAVKNLLHNNLTDSYFGQAYLAYLQMTVNVQEYMIYKERADFCNNNASNFEKNPLLSDIAAFCSQAKTQYEKKIIQVSSANQKFTAMSELKGSLSMDPRTGHMVYTTTVMYFSKDGKPNIAGSMTFDPVNNQVSGNLTKSFGESRATIYSDAFTGEVYLEYSNITKPLAQIGPKGSILTLNTIQVSKDGKVGGTFTAFHHLMNYNPNTNQLEVKLTRDSSPYNLWVNTKGELRGTYQFKVGNNISTGIMVDSKGNFTVPVNYTANGTTYGSVWIGTNGQISGQIDLAKTFGAKSSVFIGFDKNGISSVGIPIGGFAGSPFSLSVGKDGSLSFGGFVPIAGVPVPISLGQDAHGNFVISWPGGHWNLGHENRPINAPVPVLKDDKSGYDGGTIWYRHSFKKGTKTVRVYNILKINTAEQKLRGETIFKKYNEMLKRNPSISEFLNWYFYQGHEVNPGNVFVMQNYAKRTEEEAAKVRMDFLEKAIAEKIIYGYSKIVPANAKFPNQAEYKWIQEGKKAEEFPDRPADLLNINPFDSDAIAKAQTAANSPTNANVAQLTVGNTSSGQSMQQVTNAINQSISQDSNYAAIMKRFQEYFNPPATTSSSVGTLQPN